MNGWGREHPGLSANAGLVLLVLLAVLCAVWAAVEQTRLPEAPNSEVVQ